MKYGIVGLVAAAAYYTLLTPPDTRPASAAALRQADRWSWHGRIAEGKTLEIRGVNGSISAEPAGGNEAEVTAERHGRRSDPAEVRIEVVEHQDGVTICAVYPGPRNRCQPGGGPMSFRDNDVEVEFTVRVPRGVAFSGNNVNGAVEAAGLAGPVLARTVNGRVRVETSSGGAVATTVNGDVTAVVHAMGSAPMRFETVNGAVTLTLPRDLDADLDAKTVNGSITTDFPITVSGRLTPRRRIGRGGRPLQVETVNGPIRIRSMP